MNGRLRVGRYPNGSASLRSNLTFDALGRNLARKRPAQESRVGSFHASATIAILALSLAACETPAVKDRVVEVRVPVAVQPIKPAQVPVVPAPLAKRPTSLSAAADLLLAKHCEFVAYALKADPLLRLSAGMQQQALAKFPECER